VNQKTVVDFGFFQGWKPQHILRRFASGVPPGGFPELVERQVVPRLFSGLEAFMERAARRGVGQSIFRNLLDELGVQVAVDPDDVSRIPKRGPLVLVSNHPFGLLEGAILAEICFRVRQDVKIMANHLMPRHHLLREHFILVDPYGRRTSVRSNSAPLLEAVRWLRSGGALVVFPAGEVSYVDWRRRAVADPSWSPSAARLIRLSGATALPVYFHGSNSAAFHMLGMLHPRLRSLRLPAEFLNKRGQKVELRIGRPLSPDQFISMSDKDAADQLRVRTYLLAYRAQVPRQRAIRASGAGETQAEAGVTDLVEELSAESTLLEKEEWRVLCFPGARAPELMRVIGRLREETFRAVGEGTGQALDLDRFDPHYEQLLLWNKTNRVIAGGYRIARVEPILKEMGIGGLYTATLFRYDPAFFRRIGPAIELGRSFVSRNYQKQYAPLLALWQGIGTYVSQHPECRFLFGAVSISPDYQPLSRQLMAVTLCNALSDPELSRLVKPYRRLAGARFSGIGEEWKRLRIRDPLELSELIADLEPDGKGLPVLLRQYLRLGGRVLSYMVDERFSGVLDCLVMVDLLRTERALLDRYMTKSGAEAFLAYHGA